MYAVKANTWDDWPFAVFATSGAAVDCAASLHPGAGGEELAELVARLPCYAACRPLPAGDELRCSGVPR